MFMKTIISILSVMIFVFNISSHAGDEIGPRPENVPVFRGDESFETTNYIPSSPRTTLSPGIILGITQLDFQTHGSTGNRCVVDSEGGVHFTWTNAVSYPGFRAVYYNYVDTAGNWLGAVQVSQVNGAGFPQISITADDLGAIAYHSTYDPSIEDYVVAAIDNFTGHGIFRYANPPDSLTYRCLWPYVSVDINNVIHILSAEMAPAGYPMALGYTNSVDTGYTWLNLVAADTIMTLSQNVVSSPVSGKSAIVYTHPLNYDTQWQNDVYYIESQDGLTWDWDYGKINVTDYGPPDSLYAYTDLTSVYDYNDNLHIVWNAQWVTDAGVYYKTYLLHYDRDSGSITELLSTSDIWFGCNIGAWNRPVCKMSLGRSPLESSLIAVYTLFDYDDCSAGGFANGEIYMQYSCDDGAAWTIPENLTASPSPGCLPGDCESDHWSSVADRVDDSMHIVYIEDKDAGTAAQSEGTVTNNPVRYLEVPAPDCGTGIEDENHVPVTFRLSQNHPNPFNASTEISFELGNSMSIDLSIYDIAGRKLATLAHGYFEEGHHIRIWEAGDFSSGIYFYRLETDLESYTRKMTLLK
jgi:hypothetical protein